MPFSSYTLILLFATLEVGVFSPDYPPGYERWGWLTTGVFAAGAVAIFVVSRRAYSPAVGIAALVFDGCVIAGYSTIYAYEYGSPVRWALIVVVIAPVIIAVHVNGNTTVIVDVDGHVHVNET